MATAIQPTPAQSRQRGLRYCVTCLGIYRQDFQRCPLDGGALVVANADPWVGSTVGGHYVIDGLVGEGAMGRVYRAHHRDIPDRQYAIKILIGDLAASAQMRARFQQEAEHASKLAHPNVVNVIDYGVTEHDINFIVMDLALGPSLGAIVLQGPMDPARVIRLARQLCEGLEHAHSRGMIHRDFKPDNILVVGEGDLEVARIADFGLSLSVDSTVRLTTTGIVCTPAYAAPEQLRGEAIDHRVDLYALGTTIFEMLSGGILPFNSNDVDTSVRTKLSGDAPSVLMVAPNVPPALVAIVGRLLASDPARRPRSARAVLRALDGALSAPTEVVTADETQRLRVRARGTVAPPPAAIETPAPLAASPAVVDPADSSKLPNKASPITARIRKTQRKPLGRAMARFLATGLTIGAAVAYLQMRDPSRDDVASAVDTAREQVLTAVDAAVEPAPLADVHVDIAVEAIPAAPAAVAPAAVAPAAVAPAVASATSPRVDYTIAKPAPTRVDPLARRYDLVARSLRVLDRRLGRGNTDDLWALYRGIRLSYRGVASATLSTIEEAIAERSQL